MGKMKRSPLLFAAQRRLHPNGDRGIAMFGVLAVVGIATSLIVAASSAAVGTLHRSDMAESREQSLHLAEAAVSRATAELAVDPDYSNTQASPPAVASREWVLSAALSAPLETAREGEYAWIVPAGDGRVFGVGYAPSRLNPSQIRVIEVQIDRAAAATGAAFLAAGSASMSSYSSVTGGGIHTNGDLSLSGSASVVGNATATGSFYRTGSASVTGLSNGGQSPAVVQNVDPRMHRSRTQHDLCPDATIRVNAGSIPCVGSVVGNGVSGWNGWTWTSGEWRIVGSSAAHGGIYVFEGSVRVSGSVAWWESTIVVEGKTLLGNLVNGDFVMTGATTLIGRHSGVAVVASRDINLNGSGYIEGLVLAGEQVAMSGNINIEGQVVSASPNTSPDSPVTNAAMTGNARVVGVIETPAQQSGSGIIGWNEK